MTLAETLSEEYGVDVYKRRTGGKAVFTYDGLDWVGRSGRWELVKYLRGDTSRSEALGASTGAPTPSSSGGSSGGTVDSTDPSSSSSSGGLVVVALLAGLAYLIWGWLA